MRNFLNTLTAIVTLFLIFGCATPSVAPQKQGSSSKSPNKRVPSFDIKKLSQSLGMEKPMTDIGFRQKGFNDCQLPRHLRLGAKCGTQYLTILQFRLRCRNSSGTVESVSQLELKPVRSRQIKWQLGNKQGFTQTTPSGYARVRLLSSRPMGRTRFLLSSKGQVMGVSAEEVRQFVLPNYWCQ